MPARIGSPYGQREDPFHPGKTQGHPGQDMPAPNGTPIYTNKPLVVERNYYQMGNNGHGYGNNVILKDPATGQQYRIAHLDSQPDWKPGQTIPAGAVAGHIGNTGGSTGDHLHYEVINNGKPVDPAKYKDSTPLTFSSDGKGTLWNTLDKANKDPNYKKGAQPPATKPTTPEKNNDPINDIVKKKEEADKKKAQKDKEATQQNNKRMAPDGGKPRRNKGNGITSGSPWHQLGDGG